MNFKYVTKKPIKSDQMIIMLTEIKQEKEQ